MGSKFVEFDPADQPGPSSSYDILAASCASVSTDLQKWAKIRRLTPTCQVYQDISDYVMNSCGGRKIGVKTIYKIDRTGEREPFGDEYRIMLWHGTKPNTVPSIIQTGFRMGTGGKFGGGIYFADRIAVSIGFAGRTASGTGYVILAEVAPGKVYKAHHSHSDYKTAPAGFDSVKGMGSDIPNWKENRKYFGAIHPCGTTIKNPRHPQYDLTYSEYIMYDPDRIIVRFVVECSL